MVIPRCKYWGSEISSFEELLEALHTRYSEVLFPSDAMSRKVLLRMKSCQEYFRIFEPQLTNTSRLQADLTTSTLTLGNDRSSSSYATPGFSIGIWVGGKIVGVGGEWTTRNEGVKFKGGPGVRSPGKFWKFGTLRMHFLHSGARIRVKGNKNRRWNYSTM